MTIIILGRQPRLGLAELESLFGAEKISPVTQNIVQIDMPAEEVAKTELGGSVKVARLITRRPTTAWPDLMEHTRKFLTGYVANLPEGKLKFGISDYGLGASLPQLQKMSLRLKKAIQQQGRSVRAVPNADKYLNSAQIIHNKLTGPLGLELLYIRAGNQTIIAQTVREQNIEDYAFRDRSRPMRDTYVGMLPPKLAQIMVHLAGQVGVGDKEMGNGDKDAKISQYPVPISHSRVLLDPFCGTGVVLQEAALFGYSVYGTDLSEKMVRYTRDNLNWLKDTHKIDFEWHLEVADAQTATWRQPIDHVVCETYLGEPLSSVPSREKLEDIMHGCNGIVREFLKNLAPQIEPGSRHCIAVPAWWINGGLKHLPVLNALEEHGYERLNFAHADRSDLVYRREDQIVARELLVLKRK